MNVVQTVIEYFSGLANSGENKLLIKEMEYLGATVTIHGRYTVTVSRHFPIGPAWTGVFHDRNETEALWQALEALIKEIWRWHRHHPGGY